MGGFQVAVLPLQPHLEVPMAPLCKVVLSPAQLPKQCGCTPWSAPGGSCCRSGGSGKGWGSTGSIFVTAVVRANGYGTLLSYCCQRDVKFIVAFGGVGGDLFWVFCLLV